MAKESKWLPTDEEIITWCEELVAEDNIVLNDKAKELAKLAAKKIVERLSQILDISPLGERIGNIESALQEKLYI